jgi:adenylate cyclase
MVQEGFKRKLTAILSADVIGYSRLMRDDEESTVRDLAAHRVLITEIIHQHHGRVVDSPGDNILAEFASVVDAVKGAIKIQETINAQNTDVSENRQMEFRIGINLGDVIEEDDRIYGDGVNIAARVEGLAAAGGIAISGTVYEHIKDKLSLGYHYLGEQNVKNIPEPVRVYQILTEPEAAGKVIGEEKPKANKWRWATFGVVALTILVAGTLAIWNYNMRPQIEVASLEKMALPLPEKPSIAVLPFDNMSGDPEQEYIADGITENIITGLSQIPEMLVISRKSVFTYKGKSVKIKQVSEELGVKYVLEGSVQKAGDRLRVNAQLIDALKGHHLWAERYDRELKDLFKLQDEITMKILSALEMKLTRGVSYGYQTNNFEAWSHYTRGLSLLNRIAVEDLLKARKHFEQAVNLDPDYAYAWTSLARTYSIEVSMGWSKSPGESIKRSFELAQKIAALGENLGALHILMNRLYKLQGKYDKAIAEGEKSVALDPNSARAHIFLAETLHYGGRPEEAIVHAKKAMRLEPYYPAWYLVNLAGPYEMIGRYDEAIAIWKQFLERSLRGESPPIYAHERLVINYARLDRMEEARAHAAEILKIKPDYTVEFYRKATPYKDQKYLDSLVALLSKAGLPLRPPLPLPDKPSIAVLAFENMSGDPEQEYFSDGLSEEIITALSKTPKLFVIARNSSFTYKGKPTKVQQISRELGVKYVLEGSVRKSGDRVRITVQLVDAKTGNHLWAERYDGDIKDIFALQDEITKNIITALQVKLTEGEQARVWAKGTNNLDAYLTYLKAYEHFRSFTKNNMILTRKACQEAIKMDPNYAAPYTVLGSAHLIDFWMNWGKSRAYSVEQANAAIEKAITLDPLSDLPNAVLGHLLLVQRQFDHAVATGEKSIDLNPNGDLNMVLLGITFNNVRRYEEAIILFKKAQRLNPDGPAWYIHNAGISYLNLERYDEAIVECKKALRRNPHHFPALPVMASAYGLSGQLDKGREVVSQILKINPNANVEDYGRGYKFKTDAEKYQDGLRKVWYPEKTEQQ